MMQPRPKLAVAGLGNLLLKDDGIGIYLIRALRKMKLPENLVLFEIGTAVFFLHSVALEYKNLLLVDAVRGGGKPGSVYRLAPEDAPLLVQSQAERASFLSLHDFRLPYLLWHGAPMLAYIRRRTPNSGLRHRAEFPVIRSVAGTGGSAEARN